MRGPSILRLAGVLAMALGAAGAAIVAPPLRAASDDEAGFASLFDGKSLDGWQLVDGGPTAGYTVQDGVLLCPANGGGRLFTKKTYANFVLRFEFFTEPGGNNGIGIRSPLEGDPAYVAMEIQILDDAADQYKGIKPWQRCGSIYGVVPAEPGSLKKAGEWNSCEIACQGRKVKVTMNGKIIVDADLDKVKDAAVLKAHPGLARTTGHIGLLGHGTKVGFRNLRVKELP